MVETIVKTGIEWELLFHMDEHTFYRHLRVTLAQFDHLVEVLGHQGLKGDQHDGGLEIPVRQKGAIDGCHIKLQRPPVRGGDYLNRKGYYSVVLQGIVDERGRFRDIYVGAPGRVHDSRILRKSTFFEKWGEKMGRYMLLGDSAYISRDHTFIVTPKRDNGALTLQDQQRNTNICRGRVVVEQAFGRVKCKWRRMRDLQNTRLDVVVMLIMSACMLHNLCTGPADMCQEHPAGCPRHEDENI
ncbi:hypothetical protein AAFF_G00302590 [Aldrovandia affinis]|uniref:DDE Tnp4 domain-containing protein n=1 Tax=Aldrovandia affinis TaxID=143900 RepID=A0AAD7R8V4_9TELE|nr:hypothetical protein AAFF_G00302590 [Aldrovandia affinis]